MVRPVKGFLTSSGHYFDTKLEAQTYEATQDFNATLHKFLEEAYISGAMHEFMMDKVREFVLTYKDTVGVYIKLVQSVPISPTHDFRLITAPVVEPDAPPPNQNPRPMAQDDLSSEFVQAFEEALGTDDSLGEEEGGAAVLGYEEPSIEDVLERIRGGGMGEVESVQTPDESL